MAYEDKPKIIRDKDKDRSEEERESLDRQRSTRERRAEEKRVKDLRKEALDQASGTKERREVKAADEGELLAMLGRQSQEGNIYDVETGEYDTETYGEGSQLLEAQEGNIYDVETGEYDSGFNKEGTDETISNDGIDQIGVDDNDGESASSVEFNGSVLICINGFPFYIDIPYDSNTGVYPSSDGANFPITSA